jgi:hypothetical protein
MKIQASHHTKGYSDIASEAPQGMAEFLLALVEAEKVTMS